MEELNTLRVRVYNVRFGDAILVTVPDRDAGGATTLRHILIDVGNSWSKAGGLNDVYEPAVKDILAQLDGKGVDLYVMTHEHMDHVEGLRYIEDQLKADSALKVRLGLTRDTLVEGLGVKHAWLTASCEDGYYADHPKAKEQKLQMEQAYHAIASYLAASPEPMPPGMETLLGINNLDGTDECVEYLKTLAPEECTHFVWRGMDLNEAQKYHDFHEAKFEIWAPEEDTSVYYTRTNLQPMALNVLATAPEQGDAPARSAEIVTPVPPKGVDADAFYNLVEWRKRGVAANLMEIDKAANNTSVVFSLEWRGWRLLFTGDAELRSWQVMRDQPGMLKPVDFLKVGHHGSVNATPPAEILGKILSASGHHAPRALVSTFVGDPAKPQYPGVPDPETLARIKVCCTLLDTRDVPIGQYVEILFEGKDS